MILNDHTMKFESNKQPTCLIRQIPSQRGKEGREMKLEEEKVVGSSFGVFVSLLTPFPWFNSLYIEDNVLSKYGVGFKGLHYHLYISVSCLSYCIVY